MYVPHFVYLFIRTWTLGLLLSIVNNVGVSMGVQIPFHDPAFNFFGFILRNEISGSSGNFSFQFLEEV